MAARYYDPFLRMYRLYKFSEKIIDRRTYRRYVQHADRLAVETSADAWWLAGEKPGERKGGKGRKRAESCERTGRYSNHYGCTGCGAPGHLWKTCEYCGR